MANMDLAIARLQRLTTLVEGWKQSGNISNIERKLALDHLSSLYDELATAEAAQVSPAKRTEPAQKPAPQPPAQIEASQTPDKQISVSVEFVEQPAAQPVAVQAQPAVEEVAIPQAYCTSIPQAPVQPPQAEAPWQPAPTKEANPMVPPPPKPFVPTKQAPANNGEGKTLLGDQLVGNRKSLNEQFGTPQQDGTKLSRIDSLYKAIGINDRFLFTKELFSGDKELFEQTIAYLNSCASGEEALTHIRQLGWTLDNPTAKQLVSLVQRRFA